MSDRSLVAIVLLSVASLVLGAALKFGVPMSDYARLNAVEARLDVLEARP